MLIDQNPASYIDRQVAILTENDTSIDQQFALHMTVTSLAQVIAEDVVDGETPWPPTVARYIEARNRYRAMLLDRESHRG